MELHNKIVELSILLKGKIKREGNMFKLKYCGKELFFTRTDWISYPLNEIFVENSYASLGVKGKNVVDIGASVADSPIYFAVSGAVHVYGYEPDKQRYKLAMANIKLNGMGKKITIYNKPYDGKHTSNAVLKMDCEGCEYEFFKKYSSHLKKFKQIILEYHSGSATLVSKLESLGFTTKCHDDGRHKGLGILYAKRTG